MPYGLVFIPFNHENRNPQTLNPRTLNANPKTAETMVRYPADPNPQILNHERTLNNISILILVVAFVTVSSKNYSNI